MRIIISPAKQMRVDTDSFTCTELPVFTDRAKILKEWIRSLSYEEQKALWACNDKIARQNAERFAHMDLTKNLTPALLAYDGIQYTYMAPAVFEDGQFDYVQEHLRILSGFYGVVKPLDGVVPYRLEMQAKAAVVSSSIWLRRNTRNASRSISGRKTAILPASLVNWKVIRLFRRVSTLRWPEERWYVLWQESMQRLRSR